jgi:hypothetical protein
MGNVNFYMVLLLQVCKMQGLSGHGDSHPDFKGRPERPGNMCQGRTPCRQPLRGEAWSMGMKLQRRTQDIGSAGNMECLLRKTMGNKWSQIRREAMWPENDKVIEGSIAHTCGAHITTFTVLRKLWGWATGFHVWPDPSLLFSCSTLLEQECLLCTTVSWKYLTFF